MTNYVKNKSKEQILHDISLMHCCNAAPLIISGIFKSVVCNALAGLLCNEFNTLYDSIDNLKTCSTYTEGGFK